MPDAREYGTLAQRLVRQGRVADAEAALRAGLEAIPNHPILSYALATMLLRRGAFEEAWPLYEYRWALPNGPAQPSLSFPRWDGREVSSLVVLPEQGLGDQIMFARYIPQLQRQGIRITLASPPELVSLFAAFDAETVTVMGAASLPRRDAWCFIGSLPLLAGGLPRAAYLDGTGEGNGIGMMLEGGPRALDRTLPSSIAEILLEFGISVHPRVTGSRDFAETARLMRDLDLVVTVDTSVAHLAGAMGKPTWILLPYSADWRWGRHGEVSRWYPSARLFRQHIPGKWDDVASEVTASLQAL